MEMIYGSFNFSNNYNHKDITFIYLTTRKRQSLSAAFFHYQLLNHILYMLDPPWLYLCASFKFTHFK